MEGVSHQLPPMSSQSHDPLMLHRYHSAENSPLWAQALRQKANILLEVTEWGYKKIKYCAATGKIKWLLDFFPLAFAPHIAFSVSF